MCFFFFFKQKTAYEMRISDWSSDVCSSDLTVRRSETKQCSDCHLSAADDNNAIMPQLLLLGTNFVNFVGLNVWSGMEDGFQATPVTEWEDPQAGTGSNLPRYSYPELGRASWRERVCQYGEIRVVAG